MPYSLGSQLLYIYRSMGMVVGFPRLEGFGGKSDDSFPARAFQIYLFKVEIGTRTPIPLFRPGSVHSGSMG